MKTLALSMLYVFSVALAVGIGVAQNEKVYSTDRFGQQVTGCRFTGYGNSNCQGNVSGCTAGTYKKALYIDTTTADFQPRYVLGFLQSTARGDCQGTSDCSTPKSPDLTSSGCGG